MGRETEGGAPSGPATECCMCGDHGFSSELIPCKTCKFRSQHKYCSNLYPRAESYHICNWCLSQKDQEKKGAEITKTPPNPSHKTTTDHRQDDSAIKMKQKKKISVDNHENRRGTSSVQMIKKNKFPAAPDRRPGPSLAGRNTTSDRKGGIAERIMRRTMSEEMSKGGKGMIIKQVFKNRVRRRYKLLDEVSS